MAVRVVKHIRKNLFGEIIALCNPEEPWSPRHKSDAIQDIENGIHSYQILWGSIKMEIIIAEGIDGKYLKTEFDGIKNHNIEGSNLN